MKHLSKFLLVFCLIILVFVACDVDRKVYNDQCVGPIGSFEGIPTLSNNSCPTDKIHPVPEKSTLKIYKNDVIRRCETHEVGDTIIHIEKLHDGTDVLIMEYKVIDTTHGKYRGWLIYETYTINREFLCVSIWEVVFT